MSEHMSTEPIRGWAVVNPDMVIRMQIRATKRGAINYIELAEMVPMRVPAPTLADDLRAFITSDGYLSAVNEVENSCAGWIDGQIRDILRKHGEVE